MKSNLACCDFGTDAFTEAREDLKKTLDLDSTAKQVERITEWVVAPDEEVEQFKKGAKATVTVVPAAAPEASVSLDVSLKGFTAGYEAVAATLQE